MTGLDLDTIMNVTNLDLADSALHAPGGFGDTDFYPEFVNKAAEDAIVASAYPLFGD